MAKERLTLVLGLAYIICIALQWITLFIPFSFYLGIELHTMPFIVLAGLHPLIGCLFLIPSLILIFLFIISSTNVSKGIVGVILGIPGWILCIFGAINVIINGILMAGVYMILIFTIFLISLGGLLLWRALVVNPDAFKRKPIGKDRTTVALGLGFLSLVTLLWIIVFIPVDVVEEVWYVQRVFLQTFPGSFTMSGCIFLALSSILVTIYILSSTSIKKGLAGFIIAIPGIVFCTFGGIVGVGGNPDSSVQILSFELSYINIFASLALISLGVLSFWRLIGIRSVAIKSRPPGLPCSECDYATRYIREYDRYYCDHCRIYV